MVSALNYVQFPSTYEQLAFLFRQKFRTITVKPPYTDSRYNDKTRYDDNSFTQGMTLYQTLCKNVVFNI